MSKLRLLDLFSGIGGFSLGLERSGGFETVAFCEIEDFPRRVLAKHWPKVPCYHDIRELTADRLAADGIAVDAICGGFPCQDISNAGKQAGIEGERSGLWSEYARLIGELRPRVVFVENVSALLGRGLDRVLGDLAALGYDAWWDCIPASAVGAPHQRDRLWLVAYPAHMQRDGGDDYASFGLEGQQVSQSGNGCWAPALAHPSFVTKREPTDAPNAFSARRKTRHELSDGREYVADSESLGMEGHGTARQQVASISACQGLSGRDRSGSRTDNWSTEPNVGRVAHGVPDRAHRLKALGNAVVPQIPELLGRAWMEANHV
jgi:DNA (cytosine-5)-methyltransferase 1